MRIGFLYRVELIVGQVYECHLPFVLESLPVVSSSSVDQQAYLPEPGTEGEGGSVWKEIVLRIIYKRSNEVPYSVGTSLRIITLVRTGSHLDLF